MVASDTIHALSTGPFSAAPTSSTSEQLTKRRINMGRLRVSIPLRSCRWACCIQTSNRCSMSSSEKNARNRAVGSAGTLAFKHLLSYAGFVLFDVWMKTCALAVELLHLLPVLRCSALRGARSQCRPCLQGHRPSCLCTRTALICPHTSFYRQHMIVVRHLVPRRVIRLDLL
jgi:hypothetical protein